VAEWPARPVGVSPFCPPPCEGCASAQRCAAERLACAAYGIYAAGESAARWQTAPRVATHAKLLAIEAGKDRPKGRPPLIRRHERFGVPPLVR
jgi:hypothetical protein